MLVCEALSTIGIVFTWACYCVISMYRVLSLSSAYHDHFTDCFTWQQAL